VARLCSQPGCRDLSAHSHARRQADKRRGGSTARGYDIQWQKLRALKLRDEPLCRICKEVRGLIVAADSVDHLIPKTKGGSDNWENLQSLCAMDNAAKGDRDDHEYRSAIKVEELLYFNLHRAR
jgi:5-methylcytosine-specific restriction protein A